MMKLLREYIRGLINESHFPLEGGDKIRVHHSRPGTRVEDDVGGSGFYPQDTNFTQKPGRKPNGLWYECQDGSSESWKDFCEAGLSTGYSKYDSTYNVVLNDYEILFIPDEHYFDKFHKMYSIPHPTFPNDPGENIIDWPKVASHYAGIEICPYLNSRRDVSWYYGWDVASGCVWGYEGIKELEGPDDCEPNKISQAMTEGASRSEIRKIEELWWNQDPDGGEYPERDMALALINSMGLDPKSLRLWSIIFPWGEVYEPWTFYDASGEDPGFTGDEINRILDYYNSNSSPQLELFVNWDTDSGWAELESINDDLLGGEFGDWMEVTNTIEDLIEKARFETAQ